jgi:hypothetical protein
MQAVGLVWGEVDSSAPDFHARNALIEGPCHPGAKLTFEVWRERMAQGGFIVGRDIPSRALASVLRNLAVYEPLEGGEDFRIRIAGTAYFRRFGYDVTGRRLSELFNEPLFERIRDGINEVLDVGGPRSIAVEHMQGIRKPLKFEVLFLPVTAPGNMGQWSLTGMFFDDWTG